MNTESLDKSEQRIRRMFGEISPRYDFLNHFLSAGVDHYWRWQAVRTVPPQGTEPILDVCTGTGDLAIRYWNASRGRVTVVGSDFTHEMLCIARDKFAKQSAKRRFHADGEGQITFVEADTQRLPFADNRFQIVSVGFGLRNVTDTARGLGEMIRVCRPGGEVVVLEFSMPKPALLRGIYRFYFRHLLPRIGQLLSRNRESAYSYLPQSVAEFPQHEALAEIMRHAGLEPVRYKPLTFGIATLYWGSKPEPSEGVAPEKSGGVAGVERSDPPDRR
jgi:demethylmenaquinone methyltransferase/2-methoxy-6-polyprenyl-1,4-benzoquinol methylase